MCTVTPVTIGRRPETQGLRVIRQSAGSVIYEAFQPLNKYARDHNRRLTEVARDVVDRKIPHDALARQPGTS